jgi:hypothetical protein
VGVDPQTASAVVLVRPAAFGFNAEAARSNVFAHRSGDPELERKALAEFDLLARQLDDANVEVLILEDTADPPKPDAVFPNNWFTTHADGTMVVYPMATASRRLERRVDAVRTLVEQAGFHVRRVVDLGKLEAAGLFLEGTGSLVLDRPAHRAYASLAPRTHSEAIAEFDRELGYSTFVFDARDPDSRPVYHTNVLLSLGTHFAALCLDAVAEEHRYRLVAEIERTGRTIIPMSYEQLRNFSCNMIELRNSDDEPVVPISSTAMKVLRPDQLRVLETLGGELVEIPIPTIEAVGGGSVRCMIADLHLPRR